MLAQGKPLSYFTNVDFHDPFNVPLLFWLCVVTSIVTLVATVISIWFRAKRKSSLQAAVRVAHGGALSTMGLLCFTQGIVFCRLRAREIESGGNPDPLVQVVLLGEFGERLLWIAGAVAVLIAVRIIRWSAEHHRVNEINGRTPLPPAE